jgi:hypothetical protein
MADVRSGIFEAGTTPEEASEWTGIVAGAEDVILSPSPAPYTATVTLYAIPDGTSQWTGSGTFDVYLVVDSPIGPINYYRAKNVLFTAATTQVPAANFSSVSLDPPEPPEPGDGITVTSANLGSLATLLGNYNGGYYAYNPVPVTASLQLTQANWEAILTALESSGKYADLDLSACTRSTASDGSGLWSDGTFEPGEYNNGMEYIVSLILPTAATSIGDPDEFYWPAWGRFPSLVSVKGVNIETIGNCAFAGCEALETLETADFPAAQSIGASAFDGCTALESVYLPVAQSISKDAFGYCTNLQTVNLPAAQSIGNIAFGYCTALQTVDLPAAQSIGYASFAYCTNLQTVYLPASLTSIDGNPFAGCTNLTTITVNSGNQYFKTQNSMLLNKAGTTLFAYYGAGGTVSSSSITSIGDDAFAGCTGLQTVNLPAAQTIGYEAFAYCTNLQTVNLPVVEYIEGHAFAATGSTSLTVTLGSTAPTLGDSIMFSERNTAKTVTVRVPWDANGYGYSVSGSDAGETWGNGFRGGGWESGNFVPWGEINTSITLNIEYEGGPVLFE